MLVLDGVQDPGNLGTLMRTALALGWTAVVLLPACCDAFNDKARFPPAWACFRWGGSRVNLAAALGLISRWRLSRLS